MQPKKISPVTALALMAAVSGHMPDDLLGPTKPPKPEPGPEDFERIKKAKAKRERKAKRGW